MSNNFIEIPQFQSIIQRSIVYLQAGFAVHFCGSAGTGKTALALHVAKILGSPVMLLHGNDEYKSSDLVGNNYGIHKKKVFDNYIHNVWKAEESVNQIWHDGKLTKACRLGYTFIYDEFNRSRPETNNVLLSVLQEGILDLSTYQQGETQLKVHPDFAVILTSNPEEYAGVHDFQDALRDRIITINMQPILPEAEVAIVSSHSGLPRHEAKLIVDIVRTIQGSDMSQSIRPSIKVAKVLSTHNSSPRSDNHFFLELLLDVLGNDLIIKKGLSYDALCTKIENVVRQFSLNTTDPANSF